MAAIRMSIIVVGEASKKLWQDSKFFVPSWQKDSLIACEQIRNILGHEFNVIHSNSAAERVFFDQTCKLCEAFKVSYDETSQTKPNDYASYGS